MSGEQVGVLIFILIFFGGLAALFTYAVVEEIWLRLEERDFFVDVSPYEDE